MGCEREGGKLGEGAEGYSGTLICERGGITEFVGPEWLEVTGEWRIAS